MKLPRISASSYSNTAPLIWSFLYGSQRGKAEVILDTAPSRSAELLAGNRVDAALVPVIAFQTIPDVSLIEGVCVGAADRVRSVCLVTDGKELEDVRSVALDTSSKTSVALTKIIFREFLGFEPEWMDAEPDVDRMLSSHDCALIIGDPALAVTSDQDPGKDRKAFDLSSLWRSFTGTGFVFAMWMARELPPGIDFSAARDEGLRHLDEIIANYSDEIPLSTAEFRKYLGEHIEYGVTAELAQGLDLYFRLCEKHGVIKDPRSPKFI
ncbi:MAG: hypothetical protein DWQ47_14060 [Acidobacteria bacterium]|nr:MAG: hypothetical protein DWQ32_01460 [Acidobacteriota bacterium]REK02805.1 MAG: hypothetical protein DWQ38_10675 [Acidobacteriota bacterium]REK13391.1 MAG: hypothetical protein DWQ43_07150 [Acidobacteriota bacterium]REK41385.1 MAG: hypothetical protein DWQ47_14060 [Acidobacteriota bacterium]